jgi:hypothetical protein
MHASSSTDPATNQNKIEQNSPSPCGKRGAEGACSCTRKTGASDRGWMHCKVQIPIKRASFHQTKWSGVHSTKVHRALFIFACQLKHGIFLLIIALTPRATKTPWQHTALPVEPWLAGAGRAQHHETRERDGYLSTTWWCPKRVLTWFQRRQDIDSIASLVDKLARERD